MTNSVQEVDHQAKCEPCEQPNPCVDRQEEHHQQVHHNAEWRDDEEQRRLERPMHVGSANTQDQHRGTDHDECEQRADVDHLFELVNRRERGDQTDHDAGADGRDVRRAVLRMDRAENARRQQAITCHGQENSRLA